MPDNDSKAVGIALRGIDLRVRPYGARLNSFPRQRPAPQDLPLVQCVATRMLTYTPRLSPGGSSKLSSRSESDRHYYRTSYCWCKINPSVLTTSPSTTLGLNRALRSLLRRLRLSLPTRLPSTN